MILGGQFMDEMNLKIGSLDLYKGKFDDGEALIAWDSIQDCVKETCPIFRKCEFVKKGKCSLQVQYIQATVKTVYAVFPRMDKGTSYRIGMHLMPLYSQLCRQKMVELSLESITFLDHKGKVCIHPIFKEMRETIKLITLIWRDIGFYNPPNVASPDPSNITPSAFGDPMHYKGLTEDAIDKTGIIR
jgi:hypothetical protein